VTWRLRRQSAAEGGFAAREPPPVGGVGAS